MSKNTHKNPQKKQPNRTKTKKANTRITINKILFIIFPGMGSTIEYYKMNDVNGRFDNKNPFLDELRKLGQIYFVSHNWNNISYYDENEKEEQHLYRSDVGFNLADLNMKSICSKVYEDVKSFNGSFVLIGHSIGSFPLYYFSQTYASRCLCNFIIDGSLWGKFYIDNTEHNKLIKNCNKGITNEQIQELIEKVKTYDQSAVNKLKNIISGCLEKQMPTNAKLLKVKTYSFRNLQINEDPGGNKDTDKMIQIKIQAEDYFTKHNPELYKTKYLVNRTHMVFWNKEGRDNILDIIRSTLSNK